MLRFVAPAGTPLRLAQILGSLKTAASSNGHAGHGLAALSDRFHVKHVFGASSGRAALWLILRSLHRLRPEREVVAVPAYTCFSVAASIARAGLKILPLDLDPHTFEFDPSQLGLLAGHKVLCVIACNLFGFPNDLSSIRQAAQEQGAYMIDDAAQALGATRNGQFAGTLGDVGLYSLGRGKALGSIEGGLIVTNAADIAEAIQAEAVGLQAPSSAHGAWLLFEMLAYSILLRPHLFWIPNSLPFLKLGTTEFNPAFATDELHRLSLALLPQLLAELAEVNEIRRANASAVREALAGNPNFEFPMPAASSFPTFVRLPVLAHNREMRKRAVADLRRAGLGASPFYPSAICDIAGIEPYMAGRDFHRQRAESISQRLFTLPVHSLVTFQDIEQMGRILRTIPGGGFSK